MAEEYGLNIQDKITWYEEVLAQDPASPVFFNLAQLYLELGESEKAVEHLQAGLDRNPAHTQARLLLIQTLGEAHGLDKARPYAAPLFSSLQSCPCVWTLWAEKLEEEGFADRAAAVRFIGADIQHGPLTWAQVVQQGVQALTALEVKEKQDLGKEKLHDVAGARSWRGAKGLLVVLEEDAAQEMSSTDLSQSEYSVANEDDGPAGGYRTVTMADILAGQGEFEAALEIYAERLACETRIQRRQKIQERMNSIERKLRDKKPHEYIDQEEAKGPALEEVQNPREDLGQGDIFPQEGIQAVNNNQPRKHELLRRLDRLAARLEAKENDT